MSALFVAITSFFVDRRVQFALQAMTHKVPASYPARDFAEVGGLMSYGASLHEAIRQTGVYAGRILKGAKPRDLPVVQSDKLDLVINHQLKAGLNATTSRIEMVREAKFKKVLRLSGGYALCSTANGLVIADKLSRLDALYGVRGRDVVNERGPGRNHVGFWLRAPHLYVFGLLRHRTAPCFQ